MADKRVAVDMIIVKESLERVGCKLRWAPTDRQLGDVLTKDKAEPADLIRSVIKAGEYQLADEDTVLERAKTERDERKRRGEERKLLNELPTSDETSTNDLIEPEPSDHVTENVGEISSPFQ